MAKSVLIIVGHQNIPTITSEGLRSWRSVSALAAGTGTTNEMVFHRDQWMPKLKAKLIKAGIEVTVTDAVYRADVYSKNYDLAIAGHYDGGGTENRCMAAGPLRGQVPPYLFDQAHTLSEKFVDIWRKVYPKYTGMIYRPERVTSGMTENYIFDYIKESTPSVLVEHLNISAPSGNELVGKPDKVVEGDYQAICEFLGINPTKPVIEPTKDPLIQAKRIVYQDGWSWKTWRANLEELKKVLA